MTKEQLILQSSLEACRQRTEKLRYSIEKNAYLIPYNAGAISGIQSEPGRIC